MYGIEQWKAQKRFETHFDIASRFSYLAEKFLDDLDFAQNPVGPYRHEYENRPKFDNEEEWETQTLNNQYAHLLRLDPLLNNLQEMKKINWEAKSTIGLDLQPYINKYAKAYTEIKIAVLTAFNPNTQKLVESERANKVVLQEIENARHIVYRYKQGVVLKDQVVETTKELTNLLSQYTFRQAQERKPLWKKFRESTPKLNISSQFIDSENELNQATKRLSVTESSIRDIDFDSDQNEKPQTGSIN